MTEVLNIANFKGGVGKTTTSVMVAWLLSQKNKKVLFVDFDPQANATDLLYYKTYKKEEPDKTIFAALKEKDLSKVIYKLSDTLDIIPSDGDLKNFPRLLAKMFKNDYTKYAYLLDALLEPIKERYDYVFIDVPPTISDFTDNAIVAADHIAIVMQTQEFSLGAAEEFIPYVQEVINEFETDVNFLAAIPVVTKRLGRTDKYILKEAKGLFKDRLTKNHLQIRERVKAWGLTGIQNEDRHDSAVIGMYDSLTNELLEKIEKDLKMEVED